MVFHATHYNLTSKFSMKNSLKFSFFLIYCIFFALASVNASPVKLSLSYGGVHNNELVGLFHIKSPDTINVYWKKPGFGGIAPEFSFDGSENIEKIKLIYGMPVVKKHDSLINYVFKSHDMILVKFMPENPALPVTLKGTMTYGYCDTLCKSGKFNFQEQFTVNQSANLAITEKFLANVPKKADKKDDVTINDLYSKYTNKNLLVSFVLKNIKEIDTKKFIYSFDTDFEITDPIIRQISQNEFQVSLELFNMYKAPKILELILKSNSGKNIYFRENLHFKGQ